MDINDLLRNNDKKQKDVGYDLQDDLVFFMNNDPTFYRKKYFPTMVKFNNYCKQGKQVAPRGFMKLVHEAYEMYREKFQVEGLQSTLDESMCESICEYIHEQETKNCKEGMYDANS